MWLSVASASVPVVYGSNWSYCTAWSTRHDVNSGECRTFGSMLSSDTKFPWRFVQFAQFYFLRMFFFRRLTTLFASKFQMWHRIFTWRRHCVNRSGRQKWLVHHRKRSLKMRLRCKKPANVMSIEAVWRQLVLRREKTPNQRIQRSIRRKCRRKNSN